MKNINWETGAELFVDAVASDSATPGGGSAAAITAATGCGLCMMALMVTSKMKTTQPQDKKIISRYLDVLFELKNALKESAREDAKSYEDVMRARRLPKESKERESSLKEALRKAAAVPADTARKAVRALEKSREIESIISPVIISDVICGQKLLKAAVACCIENIKANMPYIKDEEFNKNLRENINFLSKFC